MAGLGTIINIAAILAGGIGGLVFKKSIKERVQNTLMSTCGICVLFLGISGAMQKMLQISDDSLTGGGTMMMVGSLAIGALVGELINIEAGIERFGEFLKHKSGNVMIMTASLGKGCIFAAIPVGLFQGSITLLSKVIEPVLTTKAMDNLSLVGSILIFCVGLNLVWGKKVKVANMLPALVIAVAWSYFR